MDGGWRIDPYRRYALRYHDGSTWTSYVSDGGSTEQDPLGVAPSPSPVATATPPLPGALVATPSDAFPASPGSRLLRVLAVFIDILIIGVPFFAVTNVAYRYTDDWVFDVHADIVEMPIPLAVSVLWFAVTAIYDIWMIGRWGRTIGKRVCGLTVVRQHDLALPGLGTATIRWLVHLAYRVPVVPVLGTTVWVVTVVMAFATPLRQTLHDKAASTVVVRSSSLQR